MANAEELPEKYAPQVAQAREGLTVADEVGLALRARRRELGMSQRRYAAAHGLSRAMLARLEAGAGRMTLETILEALRGTGFTLRVCHDPAPPGSAGAAVSNACQPAGGQLVEQASQVVPPEAWEPTDLVARVRGGSRRFPAHRQVTAVVNPPMWWLMHEFFSGVGEQPQWYAPAPKAPWPFPDEPPHDPTAGAA